MIFNGDLSKYHPADAIMFLSQLNLNGIFSIVEEQRVITLSFSNPPGWSWGRPANTQRAFG